MIKTTLTTLLALMLSMSVAFAETSTPDTALKTSDLFSDVIENDAAEDAVETPTCRLDAFEAWMGKSVFDLNRSMPIDDTDGLMAPIPYADFMSGDPLPEPFDPDRVLVEIDQNGTIVGLSCG